MEIDFWFLRLSQVHTRNAAELLSAARDMKSQRNSNISAQRNCPLLFPFSKVSRKVDKTSILTAF